MSTQSPKVKNKAHQNKRQTRWDEAMKNYSEERQKPQTPLLLKKVSQYTSPICIAIRL